MRRAVSPGDGPLPLLAAEQSSLDAPLAERLARVVLGHVTRAFPHKLDHILEAPGEALGSPRDLHPLFFGSFDWHSCVHGYWSLARLLGTFPGQEAADEIRRLFDTQITPENVACEVAYFERPASRGFERPYGWAWLLKLCGELSRFGAAGWFQALRPLADLIRDRLIAFLPLAHYPVRVGTHFNTAFLLLLASDYAVAAGDGELGPVLRAKASEWYKGDKDCQAWEPGGDEFLSPALIEAACMQRLLPDGSFQLWFDAFLPRLAHGEPGSLLRPAVVTDRSDGKLAHLDGLNLSRAWCWSSLSVSLDPSDPRRDIARDAAANHLASGLPHVAGDYMGAHWLASFALLALDAAGAAQP